MDTVTVGTWQATERTRQLVNEVLDSGRISYGPKSREFERQWANMHGCEYGVLSNSGTSALQVALQALKETRGWRDGDEVIVPATTFVATVNVILHNRLRPVLVDVEPNYYGIDVTKIHDAITSRTRAIMPVHLFGQPCDMASIRLIADRRNLAVIEDSCETAGVGQYGEPVGSWGDVGCFSFYVAHHLVCGVGGMSTTNDPELASTMRSLVNHGLDVDELANGDDYDPSFLSRKFKFNRVGHSFRVTELEAALGLAALEDWYEILNERRIRAMYLYDELYNKVEDRIQIPATRPGVEHSWMMFPLVMVREPKEETMHWLALKNIETRAMVPLVNQPAYRGMWNPDDYPVAQWLDRGGFYVGCHQGLSWLQMDHLSATLWSLPEWSEMPE